MQVWSQVVTTADDIVLALVDMVRAVATEAGMSFLFP